MYSYLYISAQNMYVYVSIHLSIYIHTKMRQKYPADNSKRVLKGPDGKNVTVSKQ